MCSSLANQSSATLVFADVETYCPRFQPPSLVNAMLRIGFEFKDFYYLHRMILLVWKNSASCLDMSLPLPYDVLSHKEIKFDMLIVQRLRVLEPCMFRRNKETAKITLDKENSTTS
jgi:hypothetical protein